VLGNRQAG